MSLIVVVLACVLGYMVLSKNGDGDRKEDDHHEQKHDDKKKQDDKRQDKIVAKPGYLHIVRERIDDVAANESVTRVAQFAAKHEGVQWRDTDKDDPSDAVQNLIAHAKSKGIDPPFVLFKSKEGNQLGNVIKLPPASVTDADLMEVFK